MVGAFSPVLATRRREPVAVLPTGALGAALVAVLAHVYIFYGFESAGDVAEEVVDAGRRVPRAMISALLIGGLTSFVLVAARLLAIPS